MLSRKMLLASVAAALSIGLPLAAAHAERKLYKIGDGVTSPTPVHKPEPAYTPEARDAKVEGQVLLSAVIEADGSVTSVQITRGLDPGLDSNAAATVGTWKFEPARKGGEPVPVSVNIQVNFRLI